MTEVSPLIEVTVRSNDGENQRYPASDIANAQRLAKKHRTPENYMVTVVIGGVRTLRWDRSIIVGENRWRKENPDAFEQLGAARSVRVVRTLKKSDPFQAPQLQCYQVGDADWFAAYSAEQALGLMQELARDEEGYEVVLASDALLDERWSSEEASGADIGSLREWLKQATEPGWLGGTEG